MGSGDEQVYSVTVGGGRGRTRQVLVYARSSEEARTIALQTHAVVISVELAPEGRVDSAVTLGIREQIDFLKALRALVDSGVPLQQCVELLPGLFPEDSPKYRLSVTVQAQVKKGADIGAALRRSARGFPKYITQSISLAGEIGSLSRILGELTNHYNTEYETRRQVTNALLYPGFIIALIIGATLAVALNQQAIVSMFSAIVDEELLQRNLGILLACFAVLVLVVSLPLLLPVISVVAAKAGAATLQVALERLRAAIPPFGKYRQERILSMFFSLLHILLVSGLTLERALVTLKGATGSMLYDRGIDQMLQRIRQGASISAAAKEVAMFPPVVLTWLKVGDVTGDMTRSVRELGSYFVSRTSDFEKKLSTIVEPLTIMIAGVLILMFVVLVVLPLLTSFGNLL